MEHPYLKKNLLILFLYSLSAGASAQNVTVSVNATQNKLLISPYIYGRNQSFDQPAQFYKDAGLRFSRMNGGNNATGYNWRKKITVHPDWYNNVYAEDWDAYAQNINSNYPGMQGMFAFQLLGVVASNTNNNFNDWAYNQAQYWSGVAQNLAGGGTPDPNGGSKALVDGDPNLFTEPWPADSSVGIINHWFGTGGLGLNKNQFLYWNMDNEVDIWNGTHEYAMPTEIASSAFMDRFIDLAKKAKALYPGIKICGPVTTSEWQWYKWSSETIYVNGKYYSWLEYFIKRLADEYTATGIKLVDVVDLHNYPYSANNTDALQLHRMYYDMLYDYPGANGIKTINGGWDNSLTKEYIFKRINDWLNQYFGPNHGITVGLSEWGAGPNEPNYTSVIYASHLGTFANNGVEYFSPWYWNTGSWETLHLFSRNAKKYSVSSTSSNENTVSAYSSVNESADSLTVIVVNRDEAASRTVTINLSNFTAANGNYKTLQLSSLPATETFVSDVQNALKVSTVAVNSNSFTISVPSLSTTAVLLTDLSVLPVAFIHESVSPRPVPQKMYADVKWQTSAEAGITGYVVERSLDAVHWQEVYRTTANGLNDYTYSDDVSALSGDLYYRIREVNKNGYGSYSPVLTLRLSSITRTTITVKPNPVINNVINLHISSQAKQHVMVRLTDLNGQTLYVSSVVPLETGENVINIPAARLAKGTIGFAEVSNTDNGSKIGVIKVMF